MEAIRERFVPSVEGVLIDVEVRNPHVVQRTFNVERPIGLTEKMVGFLDKLFNIALPRTKDFRGIDKKSVDSMGNMTFGIKEHTIFPEIKDEELKDVFGMAITIVTTAKNKESATRLFEIVGVPFKK